MLALHVSRGWDPGEWFAAVVEDAGRHRNQVLGMLRLCERCCCRKMEDVPFLSSMAHQSVVNQQRKSSSTWRQRSWIQSRVPLPGASVPCLKQTVCCVEVAYLGNLGDLVFLVFCVQHLGHWARSTFFRKHCVTAKQFSHSLVWLGGSLQC